jgi:hypothetical protein
MQRFCLRPIVPIRHRIAEIIAVSLLLCGISATAEPASRGNSNTEAALRAHIEFLADDLMEGRGAGTRGHELAARYVASQFRQLGLHPAGENGTYFQSVPLLEGRVVPEGATFDLHRNGTTEKW